MRAFKSAVAMYVALALVTSSGLGQENAGPNGSGEQAQASGEAPESMQVEAPVLDVVYEGGRLSISAHGCTLTQILDVVREKTGASFQLPAFLNVPRVVVQLGPDDPQRVLGSLLYGAGLNYIVTGSVAGGEKLNLVVALRPQPGIPIAQPAPALPVVPATAAAAESASGTANLEEAAEVAEKTDTNGKPDVEKKKEKGEEVAADQPDHTSEQAVAAADKPTDGAKGALEGASSLADRLADLPSNINPAIAALYPSLFSGSTGSTGSSSSMTAAATSSTPIGTQGVPTAHVSRLPVSSLPVGPNGIPVLPNNIPPEMWNLYPPNLMQLITNNTPPPPIPVLPLAPGLPTPGTTGQPAFWDQSIHH